jgi:hypothetical protein
MTISFKKITAFIPTYIHNKKRKHQNPKDWVNVYYYVDKKKSMVPNISITSKIPLKKNTMYKCSALSKKSDLFDYYKILKPGINKKNICIKNRLKSTIKSSETQKIHFKKLTKDNEEQFYLHFD